MQTYGMGSEGGAGTARPTPWASKPEGRKGLSFKLNVWGTFFALLCLMFCMPALHAQVSASLAGSVTDPTGAVIPNAHITLTNQATGAARQTVSNASGNFNIPSLLPGTYEIRVTAKGFKTYEQSGLNLTAGASAGLPPIKLAIGSAATTITVHTTTQILPTVNGAHAAVLSSKQIQKLALTVRDVTQLVKILPGVTTTPQGTNNTTAFGQVQSAISSTVGVGIVANGAPYRGGTTQLLDGVDITDPGCNCQAMSPVITDMTQEVTVETSNFGAESPFGPILISTISKAGGSQYHGEGYFYARNDVLNSNGWLNNHQGVKRGNAHYYYPGFNVGGPVPGTHKKLRFWFGYEADRQNTGNANVLKSFIPTPDMMNGQFGNTTQNDAFCLGASNINAKVDNDCNNLAGTTLPNGTSLNGSGGAQSKIPSQFIDPGFKVLSSFWPTANANPATTPGHYNYYQAIPGTVNGWTYRIRMDYDPSDNTQMFISYEQAYTAELASGNGAHIYWTPGNSIPYPGGGLEQWYYTKTLTGHFVHTFNANLTNETVISWSYLNAPVGPNNPTAATRSGLHYPYGTLFATGSNVLPSYSTAGNQTFPDFSQGDIFDNPSHQYLTKKEIPQFADNLTWQVKNHTIKMGTFMEEVTNDQGEFNLAPNGNFSNFNMYGTIAPNVVTGQEIGAPNNPLANFEMGIASNYNETNQFRNVEMAYGDFAAYYDDTWKATKKLSIEYGMRIEHIGHWYDKNKLGEAVFIPSRVQSDYNSGKLDAGVYWHGISPGIPSSGMPNRFAYMTPRFGVSYDVFGNGKTLVRGGWGIFRFADQYNNYTNQLSTSQEILSYGLPSGFAINMNQPQEAAANNGLSDPNAINSAPGIQIPQANCSAAYGCTNPTLYALDPLDDQIPDSTAWNLTVDQQLPMNMMLSVAYVGNHAENIPIGGQALSGGGFNAFDNVNNIPLGALFRPDPVTGMVAKNPEQVTSTCQGKVCNKLSDYTPYGKEYGTNAIYVLDTKGYSNYDALQLALEKQGTHATFNVNWTYQNNLSTGLAENAFSVRRNYGPATTTRRYVFNFSGSYTFQKPYKGQNLFVRGALNGWTISNITTWQSGGFLTSDGATGTNFYMGLQYADYNGAPVTKKNPLPNGATGPGISQATYYGTASTAGEGTTVAIQPIVTCNPEAHLAKNQILNYACFAPPKVGQYGPTSYPYQFVPYFDSDMSLYKNFHTFRNETLQFRIQATNWLNHPLKQMSGNGQLTLHYQVPYGTDNFEPLASAYPAGNPKNFGVLDQKNGQRTLELSVKYMF